MTTPMEHPTILRSNLGRMRHLGAGHNIFEHWWAERLCSVAITPLSMWFIIQMLRMGDAEHKEVTKWVGKPVNTVLLLSLMVLTFRHMQLGLEVVTNDYARGGKRMALDLCIKGGALFMGLLAVVSILKIAFTSSKK